MRESTFNKLTEEFGLETAIKVVQLGAVISSTKVKPEDITSEHSFTDRCKRKFKKRVARECSDVDYLFNVLMASDNYEAREEMDGLGCKKSNTISELL